MKSYISEINIRVPLLFRVSNFDIIPSGILPYLLKSGKIRILVRKGTSVNSILNKESCTF